MSAASARSSPRHPAGETTRCHHRSRCLLSHRDRCGAVRRRVAGGGERARPADRVRHHRVRVFLRVPGAIVRPVAVAAPGAAGRAGPGRAVRGVGGPDGDGRRGPDRGGPGRGALPRLRRYHRGRCLRTGPAHRGWPYRRPGAAGPGPGPQGTRAVPVRRGGSRAGADRCRGEHDRHGLLGGQLRRWRRLRRDRRRRGGIRRLRWRRRDSQGRSPPSTGSA
jgi:hypothetical protein